MDVQALLFYIVVGVMIGALMILVADKLLISLVKANVNINSPSGVSSSGGGVGGVGSNPSTCSDGTVVGQCSSNKPEYCDNNGNLQSNYCYGPDKVVGTADDCGCSSGSCQSDGSCAASACDSTCKAQGFTVGTCRAGTTTNTNLAAFPDSWQTTKTGMGEWGFPTPYTVLDTVNGKQAIRLDHNPNKVNEPDDRELDGAWIPIKPGERLVFKASMMTTASTVGDTGHTHGARIGLDFYASGRISEVLTPDGQPGWPSWTVDQSLLAVPWGTGYWVTKTIDFIVPATVTADPYGGHYPAGQQVVPQGFIPWISDYTNSNEYGQMWVTDTELYINPTSTATCQSGETPIGDSCPSNNLCCCLGTAQQCSDGTPYGSCNTTNKPKYCNSGTLINACGAPYNCGCPSGQSCNTTTNACYTPVTSICSDGTAYGQCSSNKPKYCNSGTLIDKCSQCECPSGYSCNSTTNNCYITTTSKNWAAFPNSWRGTGLWGFPTSYTVLDTVNGKQAIRLDHNPNKVNEPDDRELDGAWIPIKPGDRLVFKAKLMASPSTTGDGGISYHGALIGLDFYDGSGAIEEISTPDGQPTYPNYPDRSGLVAPWGTSSWKQITINFTVQQKYQTDPWCGCGYAAGTYRTPTGFIPWITDDTNGRPANEGAHIWVTDTELYINP